MATKQNTLSKAEDFKLMNLMVEELPTYAGNVPEFTDYAREKLGIPQLNRDHIYFRVKELGITLPERAPKTGAFSDARMVALEARIVDLETRAGRDNSWIDAFSKKIVDLETSVAAFKLAMKYHK